MSVKAVRETYKGRKLLVKRASRWGYLVAMVNGCILGTPYGTTQEDAERELASLRNWVDAADERRLTDPEAYGPHWYIGAPKLEEKS